MTVISILMGLKLGGFSEGPQGMTFTIVLAEGAAIVELMHKAL